MNRSVRLVTWGTISAVLVLSAVIVASAYGGGGEVPLSGAHVLSPITSGNLTIFPVVARSRDTSEFITLDEGIRSGSVIVSEAGAIQPLMRRRHIPVPQSGAQVNRLVLVNNSDKPLILLAGEIVTGGKQDRVIGKDRLVPANSDPIDLSVFCVEPGRWVGASESFDTTGSVMAQPSVRAKAMSDKNQSEVWAEVGKQRAAVAGAVPAATPSVEVTSSYAKVMDSAEVKRHMDKLTRPLESNVLQQLRQQHAVGVVVAVDGRLIWADVFASTDLLQKYWPKLVRSYAAEALVPHKGERVSTEAAQAFLDSVSGTHESVETEPGVFRYSEISGADYKVFSLTSLLPKTDFELHVAKMADENRTSSIKPGGGLQVPPRGIDF
jgi:hypothetical protein